MLQEQTTSVSAEVKKEVPFENFSFFKKYSPVIDLVASTTLSFGTSIYFNGAKAALFPLWLAPAKVFADTLSGYVDNKLFTTFVDNFSGVAAINMVSTDEIAKVHGRDTITTKAIGFGLQGVGEGTVISKFADLATGRFNATSDHYSFDNTLVTLRFGAYFAVKSMLASSLPQTNVAAGVAGMIAGLSTKNLMKSVNYWLSDTDIEYWLNGKDIHPHEAATDPIAMFVNSYLYGVHSNDIKYKGMFKKEGNKEVFNLEGFLTDNAIDMGIETIDTVLRKDILGNNKDEAIIPALYSFSNAIKDGLSTFSENFFKPSENDYDPDPLIQLDNGHYDYCSV